MTVLGTKAVDDVARLTKRVDALRQWIAEEVLGARLKRLKANVTDNLGIAKTLHSSRHDGRAVDAFTKAKEAFAALACDTRFTGIGDTDAFGGDQRGAIAAFKAAFDDAATAKEALQEVLSGLQKVVLKKDDLHAALLRGGAPCTVAELRERFDEYIAAATVNAAPDRVRVILSTEDDQ